MKSINKEDVIRFHDQIIYASGGEHGIRDNNLLESALNSAFASFDGVDLLPSIVDKISSIAYSIIKNHPMVDGNKRLGVMMIYVLCKKNSINLKYTQQEMIHLGLKIAEGSYEREQIADWITKHILSI